MKAHCPLLTEHKVQCTLAAIVEDTDCMLKEEVAWGTIGVLSMENQRFFGGPGLSKAGKFPTPVSHAKDLNNNTEVHSTIKFQLKKVLGNVMLAINFLVSLVKKIWQNIGLLHIKPTVVQLHCMANPVPVPFVDHTGMLRDVCMEQPINGHGSIVSAIGAGIMAVISAIAGVLEAIVSAIVGPTSFLLNRSSWPSSPSLNVSSAAAASLVVGARGARQEVEVSDVDVEAWAQPTKR
ncbi:hypothetical protein EW145_g4390 [Phellinidium pouzarii]|uniref:Uncharacterized protein n=1 Tax=Phellinidium pouzarii TaxID=167371 RepID=A0A4S4L3P0_9AGAM|nr:hypothetical protein EW145_g4390 [Phellinidium pouzarii]